MAGTPARPHGRRALVSRPDLVAVRTGIANRIRVLQACLRLTNSDMARSISVRAETWANGLLGGRAIDGISLLRMMAVHRVEPRWLQTGEGPMFRPRVPAARPPQIFTARTGTDR